MSGEPCQACAELRARMARIENGQAEILGLLVRLLPSDDSEPEAEPEPDLVSPLVFALAAAFGAAGFTSREACERARTSDAALWGALQAEGIKGVHHLGHWLGDHEGAGIVRSKVERSGNVWHCVLARFGQTA